MGEFTQAFGNQKLEHKTVQKRIEEVQELLTYFINYYGKENSLTITMMPEAAQKVTHLYYTLLYEEIKNYVPTKINRYKIGALTELCIIALQPLSSDDVVSNRKLNADFAFFTSSSIILEGATKIEDITKFSAHKRINEVFSISKNQRLKWLEGKNTNTFPILINGLALFTLFELYHQRFQALPL